MTNTWTKYDGKKDGLVNEEKIEHWLGKHGRWIGISTKDLSRSRSWFNRYGFALVFWGRLIPGIRTLISVPAGIELMPIVPFLVWTTAGSFIWTLLLTTAGLLLGESYNNVEIWIEPVSNFIKLFLGIFLIFGVGLLIRRIINQR